MAKNPTKKQLEANIWKFYLYRAFGSGIAFAIPTIVIFWQDNGLSLTQIMILQSLFSVMAIFLEIPSGYIADKVGRKKSLITATLAFIIGISLMSIGRSFGGFLVAEVFFAIAFAFNSGADSAFIYDTLKDLKRETEYKKIWGQSLFYGMSTMAIFNLAGGYIASFDTRYTFYFALASIIIMLPFGLSLTEPKRHKTIYKKGYMHELLSIINKHILKKKKLKWIMLYAGITFVFFHSSMWFLQPYFKMINIPLEHFGIIFGVATLFGAIVAKYTHRIEEVLGQKKLLASLTILPAIAYLLMGQFVSAWSIILILIFTFCSSIYRVVIPDYINKLTKSEIRATVLSARSLVARIFYASLLPIFGYIADVYTLQQALSIMGITIFIAGGSLLLLFHRYKLV